MQINIFILSLDPIEAAQMQCDKHAVKMVLESAQMLSTAHRMLDGITSTGISKSGKRTVKKYVHPTLEDVLYKAVHFNHPCTVWTMQTSGNYEWHYYHFVALAEEYKFRYDREHLAYTKLKDVLAEFPKNIPLGLLTPFPLAMGQNPECQFPSDPVKSYRMFYHTKQERFKMEWTRREQPEWFQRRIENE